MKNDQFYPTESAEQAALMRWAQMESGAYPELRLLYHTPNEGKRSRITGAKMKMEGLRSGVPDLFLPAAHSGMHGLFIEMKRQGSTYPTEAQMEWLEELQRQGYAVCWCRGWEAAARVILGYIRENGIHYTNGKSRSGAFLAGETV